MGRRVEKISGWAGKTETETTWGEEIESWVGWIVAVASLTLSISLSLLWQQTLSKRWNIFSVLLRDHGYC